VRSLRNRIIGFKVRKYTPLADLVLVSVRQMTGITRASWATLHAITGRDPRPNRLAPPESAYFLQSRQQSAPPLGYRNCHTSYFRVRHKALRQYGSNLCWEICFSHDLATSELRIKSEHLRPA